MIETELSQSPNFANNNDSHLVSKVAVDKNLRKNYEVFKKIILGDKISLQLNVFP